MGIGQEVQIIVMYVFQMLTECTFIGEGNWFVSAALWLGPPGKLTMAFIQGSGRVSESAEADDFK